MLAIAGEEGIPANDLVVIKFVRWPKGNSAPDRHEDAVFGVFLLRLRLGLTLGIGRAPIVACTLPKCVPAVLVEENMRRPYPS
jgi:hypothetical protein